MAITTIYDGIEYRSRLEARWGAFFQRIGWQTTYEPFDGDGYIPDFLVHGERPMLIEVKPAVTLADYEAPIAKITTGLLHHWQRDILIVGADPMPRLTSSAWPQFSVAGLIGEQSGEEWWWTTALWSACAECHQPTVWHDYASYATRPCCLNSRGDKSWSPSVNRVVHEAWADACNDVKWRGRVA